MKINILLFLLILCTCIRVQELCDKEHAKNIHNFIECYLVGCDLERQKECKHHCIVNNKVYPRTCQTRHELPLKFVEEVVENVKNTNCEKNEDCMLVNTDYNWRCCYEGYCESPNYVSDKWISVNKVWFEQQQKKFCDFYKATSSNCTKELISKGKKCYENYKADGRFYGHCKKTETGGECIKMRVNHISSLEIALVVIFAFGTITVLAGFLAYFGCSTAISRLFKQYKFVTATEQERTGLVDNEDPADSDTEEDLMGTEGKSEEKKIEEVKVEEIKVDDKPAEETKSKEEKKTDEAKEPENKEVKTEEKSTAEEKTVEQEKSSDQNEKTTSDEQKV